MHYRSLGRTGHQSSVAILGGFAFGWATQDEADALIGYAREMGVNHVDLAPGYGDCELRFGSWAERERERWFIGGKTTKRSAEEARAELERSLERIRTDRLDLWQMHGVSNRENLDQVCAPGGAFEAFAQAKEEGLCAHVGITGHGYQAPILFREAIDRLPLDTVMLPVGAAVLARPAYRAACENLLAVCRERGIGVMAIKCLAHEAWKTRAEKHRTTWYRPLDDPAVIPRAVRLTLSQRVTGLCTSGDADLVPPLLEACRDFQPLDADEQKAFLAECAGFGDFYTAEGGLLQPQS